MCSGGSVMKEKGRERKRGRGREGGEEREGNRIKLRPWGAGNALATFEFSPNFS